MKKIKIIIADDHKLYTEGLKLLFQRKSSPINVEIVGICNNGEEVIEHPEIRDIDLLLLDLKMPELDGFNLLPILRKQFKLKTLKILVITQYDEDKFIRLAFKNGADGYMLKSESSRQLFKAMQAVLNNEVYLSKGLRTSPPKQLASSSESSEKVKKISIYDLNNYLTKREVQILEMVSKGVSNREIAKILYISQDTVMVHRRNILKKLRVKNTAGLIKFAVEHNIV